MGHAILINMSFRDATSATLLHHTHTQIPCCGSKITQPIGQNVEPCKYIYIMYKYIYIYKHHSIRCSNQIFAVFLTSNFFSCSRLPNCHPGAAPANSASLGYKFLMLPSAGFLGATRIQRPQKNWLEPVETPGATRH